jgi:hypothetical protein
MTASRPATISNAPPAHPALDAGFLFVEGLRHIRRLAGSSWTDHNTHDPGITILEQLCYALTDLAYRLSYDVPDLLTRQDGTLGESLYSPAQLLTVNPVTLADIRKVVLDVPGVKNAWIEQVTQPAPAIFYDADHHTLKAADDSGEAAQLRIRGLYRVLLEPDDTAASTVEAAVWARLHQCRSLGEDFSEVRSLPPQGIELLGTIELDATADVDALAAAVQFQVAELISPRIRFYTLQERLSSGLTTDELFDGPALQHGFIDDQELEAFGRRTEIHVSDIIRAIMALPGVKAVNAIALREAVSAGALKEAGQPVYFWSLTLDKEKSPSLLWPRGASPQAGAPQLAFVQKGVVVRPDEARVAARFEALRAVTRRRPLESSYRDRIPKAGQYRNAGAYYSIQHHFPAVYGLGDFGLPANAPPQRHAQAKQLKGYLLFFEQLLADYFAQVGGLQDLVAFDAMPAAPRAYQPLAGVVPGVAQEEVLLETAGADSPFGAGPGEHPDRQHRFLNHLLARFGESLTDFSRVLPAPQAQPEQFLTAKLRFLQAYPQLSNDRGKAFDYTAPSWDTLNVSGLEKRVAAKLGITDWRRRSLAAGDQEGLHMLEHVLLRPLASDVAALLAARRPVRIEGFEPSDQAGRTWCKCPKHGLAKGDTIELTNAGSYNGVRLVTQAKPDAFELATTYHKENDAPQPTWQRPDASTLLALARQPIDAFAKCPATAQRTVCTAKGHQLATGAPIRIIGTAHYNGSYVVGKATPDTFEIDKSFEGDEAGGSWLDDQLVPDPYSLQLSFVLPDWPPRFKDEEFRVFVQQTIRAQTPAHLRVYVKWLSQAEMEVFEGACQQFLAQLQLRGYGRE